MLQMYLTDLAIYVIIYLLAISLIESRGYLMKRKAGRPAITTDLTTRVCVKGHVGNWKLTPRGSTYCKTCAVISQKEHRLRHGKVVQPKSAIVALTERREYLTKQIAEVMVLIAVEELKLKQE